MKLIVPAGIRRERIDKLYAEQAKMMCERRATLATPERCRAGFEGGFRSPRVIKALHKQAGGDDYDYALALRIVSDELWDRVKDRQDAAAERAAGLAERRTQQS